MVIIITGASSGIGKALAKYYAKNGITLGLTGQNEKRLKEISDICEDKGAKVISKTIDVRNYNAMEKWLIDIDNKYPIDIIIANAGISAGSGNNKVENISQIKDIFDVNIYGVINTITPIQNKMISRKKGQIAIISSIAAYRGQASAPAYCASKSAVKTYGESLRLALSKYNVKVNVICPGFVKSRITDQNDFYMPFLMEAEKAAKIIAKGIEKNKGRIAFPLITSFAAWILMILPDFIAQYLCSLLPSKPANNTYLTQNHQSRTIRPK